MTPEGEPDLVPRDRCPRCGGQFHEVHDDNRCPYCGLVSDRDELIGEDDDYEWVL